MEQELENQILQQIDFLCQGLSTDDVAKLGFLLIAKAAEGEKRYGTPAYAVELVDKSISVLQRVRDDFDVISKDS